MLLEIFAQQEFDKRVILDKEYRLRLRDLWLKSWCCFGHTEPTERARRLRVSRQFARAGAHSNVANELPNGAWRGALYKLLILQAYWPIPLGIQIARPHEQPLVFMPGSQPTREFLLYFNVFVSYRWMGHEQNCPVHSRTDL